MNLHLSWWACAPFERSIISSQTQLYKLKNSWPVDSCWNQQAELFRIYCFQSVATFRLDRLERLHHDSGSSAGQQRISARSKRGGFCPRGLPTWEQ